jgi:membrane associated rhomboid family serine protease
LAPLVCFTHLTLVQNAAMFPYSCDAKLFHLPIATGALIVLNILVFGGFASGRLDPADGWVLEYGTGLHPAQWLLSAFTHGSFGHLLGNMFFLWAFGLVTEGKLGWWRFLLAYLGIATSQSAIEQAIMPMIAPDVPFTLGASAAIYGLMAMACVWAPVNELSVFMLILLRPITFELAIGAFAALYVGIDLFYSVLMGAGAIGSITHLMGGAMGFVLGIVLLKTGVVDCEDWDLLSVLSGTYGADKQKLREATIDSTRSAIAHSDEKALETRRKFDAYLQIDQPDQALAMKRRAEHTGRPLDLDRQDLLKLITGLHKHGKWAESAPVMAELMEVFPVDSQAVRLKLAQICLMELDRPGRALELLDGLDVAVLPPQQETLRVKIAAAAKRKVNAGELEVDDGAW